MSEERGGITGRQRRFLRARAHALSPVVRIGNDGVTDGVRRALDQALLDHELVKVRLVQPEDKRATARTLAADIGAELCGVVGHTVILYRAHPEEPRIELPAAGQA